MATTVDPAARSLPAQLVRLARNSHREPHGMGWISARDYRAAGLRRVWRTIRLVLDDRIEDRLPLVVAPTLAVRGTRDPLVPHAWAQHIVELLPQGTLVEIPGAAHTLNFFEADRFVQAIAPFLGLVRAPLAGPA